MLKLECNRTNVRPEIAAIVTAALNKSYWLNDVSCSVRHKSIEFTAERSSWTVDIEFNRQDGKYEVCWFENNIAEETVIMDSPELIIMYVMDTFF